jgi:hypothetical protein
MKHSWDCECSDGAEEQWCTCYLDAARRDSRLGKVGKSKNGPHALTQPLPGEGPGRILNDKRGEK